MARRHAYVHDPRWKFRKVRGRWQWIRENPKKKSPDAEERIAAFAKNAHVTYPEAIRILQGFRRTNKKLKHSYVADAFQ